MDSEFDRLAKALAAQTSRRGVLRVLAGGIIGGLAVCVSGKTGGAQAQACASLGQPCCAAAGPTGCLDDLVCTDGICRAPGPRPSRCGQRGHACCATNIPCGSGLSCEEGICLPDCGRAGQPCCPSAAPCRTHLTCAGGICIECGSIGQSCCAGPVPCRGHMICEDDICVRIPVPEPD